MDIDEFLLARWAEKEQIANEAINPVPRNPTNSRNWTVEKFVPSEPGAVPAATLIVDQEDNGVAYVHGDAKAAHIALHDPAAVLLDIVAKRAILAELRSIEETERQGLSTSPNQWGLEELADVVRRRFAAPHAAHPDFNPAWAV